MDLGHLYYRNALATPWIPFPAWTKYYIEIGKSLAKAHLSSQRIIIGLAVPTRSYAACLAATGTVATLSLFTGETEIELTHFEKIKKLPIGAPLVYIRNDKKFKAKFWGCTTDQEGQPAIRVKVQEGEKNLAYVLNVKKASAVAETEIIVDKLPKSQKGKNVNLKSNFIAELANNANQKIDPLQYVLNSNLNTVILGPKHILRDEIIETEIAVPKRGTLQEGSLPFPHQSDSNMVKGSFNDILRVKSFQNEGEGFRSEILPLQLKSIKNYKNTPAVAIIDGSTAYLKFRNYYRYSHLVIIFDRADSNFEEAVEQFNNDYRTNRKSDWLGYLPKAPKGIDTLAFIEELK